MKLFQSDLLSVTGFIFVICFTDSTKRTIHGDTVFSVRITCQKLGRQMFAYKMSNRRTEKKNKEAPWRSINPRGTHLIPVRKLPYPHQLHAHHGNSSGHLPPVGVTLQLLAWWCCISLEFFFSLCRELMWPTAHRWIHLKLDMGFGPSCLSRRVMVRMLFYPTFLLLPSLALCYSSVSERTADFIFLLVISR